MPEGLFRTMKDGKMVCLFIDEWCCGPSLSSRIAQALVMPERFSLSLSLSLFHSLSLSLSLSFPLSLSLSLTNARARANTHPSARALPSLSAPFSLPPFLSRPPRSLLTNSHS